MSQLAVSHRRKPRQQLTTRLWPIERMVSDSIAFIREHEPPEGYFVGFSGGKDSIVTLKLVQMAGVKHEIYYSCTGIDPPEVVKFIKRNYPDVQWLRPKRSFWEGVRTNIPPTKKARWCCDKLKKDPSKNIPLKTRIMGIRAEESRARAKRGSISYIKRTNQMIVKPIFNWLEWHIWEFIEEYGLVYPILYDEGFNRIGCVVCPFKNKDDLRLNKTRYPGFYKAFEHAVSCWWDSGRAKPSGGMIERLCINSADEYLAWWYNNKQPCTCPSNDCAGV
jgi:phosphoadenosine phosphosulfate reductase